MMTMTTTILRMSAPVETLFLYDDDNDDGHATATMVEPLYVTHNIIHEQRRRQDKQGL